MLKTVIALDHHTQCHPIQGAIEYLTTSVRKGPESLHHKEAIYDFLDARSDDLFVCTPSGAEAICQVIWSVFAEVARKEGKTQFITSCMEDASTLQMLQRCETLGCSVKIAPVNRMGRIDVVKLAELITPRTALITVTCAHGLTGVVQPIEEIGKIAKKAGVLLHLDASYIVGKTHFSFQDCGADYLTFAGERIHSVKSGAVFARRTSPLIPFVLGNETHFDLIGALGIAANLASVALDTLGLEGVRLRNLFEANIQKELPEAKILFQNEPRLPNTTAIFFPKIHSEALDYFLKRNHLYPNESGGYLQHLHKVLELSDIKESESALSFSLSRMTKEEEIIRGAKMICEKAKMLGQLTEDLF